MTYNQIIQKAGKIIKKHVYYIKNGVTTNVSDDNVERIKFDTQIPLVGTTTNGCEITLKEKIDGDIYVQIEAKYGTDIAIETYGPFNLKEEPTYDANKKAYLHKTYDNMLKSMVYYLPITMTYPCTVYQFFSRLTTELGYTNNISSLPNGSRQIENDIYDGIEFTYRDVLDDIAYANGVLFYIDGNEIKIATLGGDSITIDDDILKNQNIDFGEHYGPINTIVLSRSSETDNVYTEDAESVAQNGKCEFKIIDNQLMNGTDRTDYLPALLNQLDGIEYDIYDTELTGFGKLRPLQTVNFSTNSNTYSSYIFNNEITLTTGYKQAIYNERPEQTETEYKYTDAEEKQEKQAYIIINKKIGDVDIRGKTINMTADDIAINSTNFQVTKDGDLTCNNANINGTLEKTVSGTGTVKIGKSSGRLIEFDLTAYSNNYYADFNPEGFEFVKNNQRVSELLRNGFYLYNNGSQTISLDGYDGSATFNGTVTAGNIDSGMVSITPVADTPTSKHVDFNKTFNSVPIVVATPESAVIGSTVKGVSVANITTTGFDVYVYRTNTTSTNINWIAMS